MSVNRIVIAAVVVIAAIYVLFSSMYVVNAREQAIVTRFGKITEVHSTPGLYFKLPTAIVDNVQIIERRLLRYDIANMTLQVKGGKFYVVDAFLTYRISDPRLFRERALGDLKTVEDRIDARFQAALRTVYGLREFDAALSAERSAMMEQTKAQMVKDMSELGVEIVDVRILRTDLTTQVSQQTYDRMKAERLAEAALLRARGQEAAQTARAIADRQAVEIIAAARGDSEKIRGEGDGQVSQIFAAAYNKDPSFFEFYRSLQSYRTALGSSGTTMVLSPDSEFFKFFSSEGSSTDAQGATPAPVEAPIEPPSSDVVLDNPSDGSAPATGDLVQPDTSAPANDNAVTPPSAGTTASPPADTPTAPPPANDNSAPQPATGGTDTTQTNSAPPATVGQ